MESVRGETKVDDFIKGTSDIKTMTEVKTTADANGLLVEVKGHKMIREDLSGFNELLKSKKSKENKCDVSTPNSVHVLWVYGSGGCMVLVVMYFQF